MPARARNPLEDTLRKLRMSSIYGGGMPDLDRLEELAFGLRDEEEMRGGRLRAEQESRQGRQFREKVKYDNIAKINEHNRGVMARPRLQQIAQAVAQPEVNKPPMNVVFRDSISPYQQAQIAARDKDRESRENIAEGKLTQGDTKITNTAEKDKNSAADRERRTKILESKDSKDLSEKETIELNALNAAKRAEKAQEGMNTRQEDAQAFTSGRDTTLQGNALERIAATLLGRDQSQINAGDITSRHIRERAAADDKPQSSTQEKTAIQLRMNQLLNEKPELRDHIKLIDGMPEIEEDSGFWGKKLTPAEIAEINKRLYGSGGNTPVKTTPAPVATNRPDPMGIRQ